MYFQPQLIQVNLLPQILQNYQNIYKRNIIIMLINRLALGHVNYNFLRLLKMENTYVTGLKLKNSLTGKLEDFKTMEGKNIKWYTCGPTVYSNSHMGHARNYLCNDMIRRILRDYFGYNVNYCMNITDVQDKIINNSQKQNIEYFEFARKWQADFFDDMEKLGVQLPDSITRVTQYMPEIIKFIEVIVQNGYAYQSNGSVYFDIEAYKTKFSYGKLKRIAQAQTQEEEKNQKGEKKNKEDFALWKAAKPGQPKWTSLWGQGRPGWHIECSAMASAVLGKKLDIHSGGVDLIFPHHENELAQSQAHFNQAQWTKYFIHVGHLHIKGLKMSKSLKNFITIKQLLKRVHPRVIKLYFFIHRYDVILDYNPQTSLQEASNKDKRYKDFLGSLQSDIRQMKISSIQKLNQEDEQFLNFLEDSRTKIHDAFCDNINTPAVFKQIDELIKKVNIYKISKTAKITLLTRAQSLINQIFRVIGLDYSQGSDSQQKQTALINTLVKFRDSIRENAKTDFKKILEICDRIRDNDLVDLNIKLEDKNIGEPTTWRHEDKETIIKQRQMHLLQKAKKQQKKKAAELQKLKQMQLNPKQMFLNDDKWTQFDENGIPTHEKAKQGDKPINQKTKNVLTKKWNAQNELHQKYIQSLQQEKKE